MKHHLWTILFGIVLVFYVFREQHFAFVYYTIQTFTLEFAYFAALTFQQERIANTIWPFLVAPAIVVCVGFWVIIAPMEFSEQPPTNLVIIFVTHGLNMVAVLAERKKVFTNDIWKPILYTSIYNTFLALYVGAGGRSKSGHLPYWFAQYDQPIGWIFAALAIASTGVVHFIVAVPKDDQLHKTSTKQYIV